MRKSLFSGQTANATSPWFRPGAGTYTVHAHGGLGSGTLKILLSADGVTASAADAAMTFTATPAPFQITLTDGDFVAADLSGATAATLTVDITGNGPEKD